MKKLIIFPVLFIILVSFLFCRNSAVKAEQFTELNDYQAWAFNKGYPQGLLVPLGFDGVNQDYFHSLPGSNAYTSGKIVVGDSRCCQLGIYQNRTGSDDYAVFAVWGGHYVPGTSTPILTEQMLSELEQCFQEQIRTNGCCTVFFFATVNDYDYASNNNTGNISAAVSVAETIASMSYLYKGIVFHPKVIVIGFEGIQSGIIYGDFNRYIDSYNSDLREAVYRSVVLQKTALYFTTVPEITGGTTSFISDGLHYSENTLRVIADYLTSFSDFEQLPVEDTAERKEAGNIVTMFPQYADTSAEEITLYRIGN